MQKIEIRDMTDNDLNRVMEIENSCFVAPWKLDDLKREIHENVLANMWVITVDDFVVGFSDYWHTFDSGTICQIAIDKRFQHQSLGSKLLKEIFASAYAKRIQNLTLEVRESNKNAISFYLKHGFKIVLNKKNYYSNGENAIYMIKEIKIDE